MRSRADASILGWEDLGFNREANRRGAVKNWGWSAAPFNPGSSSVPARGLGVETKA